MAIPTTEEQLAQHAACVRALAAALAGDATGDDVAQEATLLAWRRGAATGGPGWLAVVVRRLAGRARREAARRWRRERTAARGEAVPAAAELASRSELLQRVAAAVAALPPLSREVVLLRFYENLPPRKVAARLGLTVAAVHSRLRRALDELRAELQRRLGPRDLRGALAALVGPPALRLAPPLLTLMFKTKLFAALAITAAACLLFIVLAPWRTAPALPGSEPFDASAPQREAAERAAPARDAPTNARIAAADAPRNDAGARAVTLTGRVVDERRYAVSGAAVTWRDERATATAISGEDGAFAVALEHRGDGLDGVLTAEAEHLTALLPIAIERWLVRDRCDVGAITLHGAAELTVSVTASGAPVHGAGIVVQSALAPGSRWQETARTGPDGTAALLDLPPGRCLVLAEDGDAAASAVVDLVAGAPAHARIELTDGLALRVEVRAEGAPLSAASVVAHERMPDEAGLEHVVAVAGEERGLRTDEQGRAVVRGLRAGQVVLIAAHAGARRAEAAPVRVARDLAPVRIDLPPAVDGAVRWRIEPGDAAPPGDGTALALRNPPGRRGALPAGATVHEQSVVVRGPVRAGDRFLAVAPDGALALLEVPPPGGEGAARFRRPRRLTVELRDERDTPLVGWPVCVRDAVGAGWAIGPWRSDAAGRIAIEGLEGGMVEAVLDDRPLSYSPAELVLGVADLDAGDAVLTVRRPAPRRIVASVWVDDELRLPPDLDLRAEHGHCASIVEDPARGALTCELWPHQTGAADRLLLYGPFDYSIGVAEVPAGSGDAHVELRLERHATAFVDLRPPVEGPVRLQLRLGGGGTWSIRSHVPEFEVPAAVPLRFSNLRPGRYRMLDDLSGVEGPEVLVSSGAAPVRLELDLSRVVTVAGRVVGSAGAAPNGALVEVSDGTGAVRRSMPAGPDGAFSLRVSVDRPDLRLVARCEGFVSDPAAVTGPAPAEVLTLRPQR